VSTDGGPEYPFLHFLSVPRILRRLVTRLNVRRYEVNQSCSDAWSLHSPIFRARSVRMC